MAAPSIDRRTINRGETLGFMFSDSKATACEITLLQRRGGDDQMTPREIQPDAEGDVIGTLTEDETDIAPGQYFLIATLTGDDYRQEQEIRFTVREPW